MNINYKLWPNTDGNLGNIKVQIPTGIGDDEWPDGDALVGNFVYKNGIVSALVDTKALIVNDSKSTTFPYDYVNIQVDKSLEGTMTFNKGERTKYLTISYTTSGNGGGETAVFVIIDFNTTDAETINTVRTAKRVVDNKLYDANGGLIGTIDTSKIEVGGIFDGEAMKVDGLFCNMDIITMEERGLILSEFESDLSSLRDGSWMFFQCANLASFSSDLSSLTNGMAMFRECSNLTSFTSDLSSLTYTTEMFAFCSNLTTFDTELPSLTDGQNMFFQCANLASFSSDMPSLTDGSNMFNYCANLELFSSDLFSLTNGRNMFQNCSNLTSFNSDLSSLTNGVNMFESCKLDTASVQNVANTIKNVSSLTDSSSIFDEIYKQINIGIGNSTPNDQEKAAFNEMVSKGWTVYVNGSKYTDYIWSDPVPHSLSGETTTETPIPFYAKSVPATEETASYVDANGNFFNILGGQFIYGDDLSTYGMFTCEEDAAANLRLTKIEKPLISKFALKR